MSSFHTYELVAAATFASLSFGAFSNAAKEEALANELGPTHPAYEEILKRVALPEGLGKTFGATAVVVGVMGAAGLVSERRHRKRD